MDDLLAEFVAESREMLDALGSEIVAWEVDPSDRERLDAIFRFVHTVKGNCGFFDFPRLEALSHAAEDALSDVRANRRQSDTALVSAILAIIDRIGDMVGAIDAGQEFPEGGDLALITALEPDAEASGEELRTASGDDSARQRRNRGGPRSVRLPVDLLDQVMSGVSDMVLARNDLAHRLRGISADSSIDAPFNRLSSIIAEVRDAMTRTRMQRIETLFSPLPRMVRDLSAELGKQVMIDFDGGDVELDREMIELIRDPMVHVVRNAIDHGFEAPAKRLAAGKREIGLLTISARQTGNEICIGIVDDGRGINGDKLVERAIAAGIVTAEQAARMTARERFGLICEAGLSTTDEVTAISGRGVGMDVVRANLEKIGGSVKVDSTPGVGTRILLNVPLTLSIVPALTLGSGGLKFGIPRSYVKEVIRAEADDVAFSELGDATQVTIRGVRLPCIGLDKVLQLTATKADKEGMLVVLKLVGGDTVALRVDHIHDHEELVVKPIAPAVAQTGFYVGTTQLDDGSPVLMLDVAGILREGGVNLDVKVRAREFVDAVVQHKYELPIVMFHDFAGRKRAFRQAIIERIEEVSIGDIQPGEGGMRVVIGERIIPLTGLDGSVPGTAEVTVLRLNDGASTLAYAIRDVIDFTALETEIIPSARPGEVEGTALVDGDPVDIMDAHWLFARSAIQPGPAVRPICRLPGSDPWARNFLWPIVEAAGYRIIEDNDYNEAMVAIETPEIAAVTGPAAQIIRLRTSPDETPDTAGSIWRYDRAGLTAALRNVAAGAGR